MSDLSSGRAQDALVPVVPPGSATENAYDVIAPDAMRVQSTPGATSNEFSEPVPNAIVPFPRQFVTEIFDRIVVSALPGTRVIEIIDLTTDLRKARPLLSYTVRYPDITIRRVSKRARHTADLFSAYEVVPISLQRTNQGDFALRNMEKQSQALQKMATKYALIDFDTDQILFATSKVDIYGIDLHSRLDTTKIKHLALGVSPYQSLIDRGLSSALRTVLQRQCEGTGADKGVRLRELGPNQSYRYPNLQTLEVLLGETTFKFATRETKMINVRENENDLRVMFLNRKLPNMQYIFNWSSTIHQDFDSWKSGSPSRWDQDYHAVTRWVFRYVKPSWNLKVSFMARKSQNKDLEGLWFIQYFVWNNPLDDLYTGSTNDRCGTNPRYGNLDYGSWEAKAIGVDVVNSPGGTVGFRFLGSNDMVFDKTAKKCRPLEPTDFVLDEAGEPSQPNVVLVK